MPQREPLRVEPFDILRVGGRPVGLLRQAAMRTAYWLDRPVFIHDGAIWVSRSDEQRALALVADLPKRPMLTSFGQPLRIYADGDAWRWDHGHVAQARAHAELRNLWRRPAARIVRAVNRLLSRGTR